MKRSPTHLTNESIALKVSFNTIILNVLLSAFKMFAGIISHSGALISDAIHSISDVLSTMIVIIGVKAASRDSDENHPYGHERLECVASIILSIILCATGAYIGYDGLKKVVHFNEANSYSPGGIALVAAILSIVIKEGMYWYTRNAAKKIHSGALLADAWHHRSDAFTSIGSLIGVIGMRIGIGIADPIASVIICIFIIKVSIDIFRDAIYKLIDVSCDEQTLQQMQELILKQHGVLGIDELKTRIFGSKIYVDIEILADKNLTLAQAHDIAESVHDCIEEAFPLVKHCMVHVNPH